MTQRPPVNQSRPEIDPKQAGADLLADALSAILWLERRVDRGYQSADGTVRCVADVKAKLAAAIQADAGCPSPPLMASVNNAAADRAQLMREILLAGQRAGIIDHNLESVSVTQCLHILECLSKPAAVPPAGSGIVSCPAGRMLLGAQCAVHREAIAASLQAAQKKAL